MKKLLIVLLALTVIGMFAVAQDAPKPVSSITAWNEGIFNLYNQSGSADATATVGPAWAGTGVFQEWYIGYAGNNYGFNSTIDMDTNTGLSTASFIQASAYYNFGDMLKLTLGRVRDGTYRAAGALIEGGMVTRMANNEEGVLIQVAPIAGLSVGAFANIASTGIQKVADYSTKLNVGASYAMPDMFKATVTYRTIDKIFNAGASITAIKPVSIVVGFQSQDSNMYVYGSVGTKVGDSLAVNADVKYNKAAKTGFAAEGSAEYAMGQFALGARFGYDDGNGAGLLGNNDNIGAGVTGLYLYPYAAANFDNGSSVRLGLVYGSGAGTGNTSLIQIPLLYVWAF